VSKVCQKVRSKKGSKIYFVTLLDLEWDCVEWENIRTKGEVR